jgi:DNA-binding response OmpR family regulator
LRKVIVHIEDNEGDAFLIKQGFRKLDDVELVQFERGEEAFTWLEDNEAELILVDWFLPDMEGDEFVSRARGAEIEADIVLLTGLTLDATEAPEGIEVANKPQSLAELRELIAHLTRSYGIASVSEDA